MTGDLIINMDVAPNNGSVNPRANSQIPNQTEIQIGRLLGRLIVIGLSLCNFSAELFIRVILTVGIVTLSAITSYTSLDALSFPYNLKIFLSSVAGCIAFKYSIVYQAQDQE
jgi:hypothetical protein